MDKEKEKDHSIAKVALIFSIVKDVAIILIELIKVVLNK